MTVSFIGLGNMGQPMAANLAARGGLTVWNRTRARAEAVKGARVAASIAEASRADVVITMVADDRALEEIAWDGGLIEMLPRDGIHVSMSTIGVALADRLAKAHDARGARFVSAPVFGRPEMAAAGKLFIVAAGPAAAIDACQPLFDAMGQRTFRFGERASAANVVKLSGNFLIAVVIESLGETFALARKSGIDPRQLAELLTSTLFAAPVYQGYSAIIAEGRYRPAGFRMPLGLKDVTLALDAARAAMVPLPLGSLIRDHMISAIAQGYEDADWAALGELAAKRAGL